MSGRILRSCLALVLLTGCADSSETTAEVEQEAQSDTTSGAGDVQGQISEDGAGPPRGSTCDDYGPCLNGGLCVMGDDGPACDCAETDHSGTFCETPLTGCEGDGCDNGGACVDSREGSFCECLEGFEGPRCETDIDDCDPSPCENDGVCVDEVAGYACDCDDTGFEGEHCEVNVDDCLAATCLNGGVCVDGLNAYTCDCTGTGFGGEACELSIDDCQGEPCQNGGLCVDGVNTYTCDCTGTGYEGPACESNVDDCTEAACDNGGSCVDGLNGYTCDCTGTGFEGTACETNIDDCVAGACDNGGSCLDGVNGFSCDCSGTGFEGPLCEQNVDDCAGEPCQNGGLCSDGVNTYSCDCAGTGFEGDACETHIDDCVQDACANAGVCVDGVNAFTCDCAGTGFEGATCQDNVDDCVEGACLNGGVCLDQVSGFTCDCGDTGYEGENCEIDVDDCAEGACLNGGACVDALKGYSCDCAGTGFEGASCEVNIDDCGPGSNCVNGGVCVDGINGFSCDCQGTGHGGKTCDIKPRTIAAGRDHTCATKGDGTLWCWGSNNTNFGVLGDGSGQDQALPVQVSELQDVTHVSAGTFHTCAVVPGGEAWCWGDSGAGKVGTGMMGSKYSEPYLPVSGLDGVPTVTAGNRASYAIDDEGQLWIWGWDSGGAQTGIPTAPLPSLFEGVSEIGGVRQVSHGATGGHGCAVVGESILCWGDSGECSLGSGVDIDGDSDPVLVAGDHAWRSVSAGEKVTCGLTTEGEAWCWGFNEYGAVGNSEGQVQMYTVPQKVNTNGLWTSIAAGSSHVCALEVDQTVWCWGRNDHGQLGFGGAGPSPSEPSKVTLETPISELDCGHDHCCARAPSGSVWCWGHNESGAIGNGESGGGSSAPTPVQVIGEHCSDGLPCASGGVCQNESCEQPSCDDALLNGSETDVDCGGVCALCDVDQACVTSDDCGVGDCSQGVCTLPTCDDGIQNGGETEVDCGGTCGSCEATCDDGIQNGDETDIDCAGGCAPCLDDSACVLADDCASGWCEGGVCVTPTCTDGVWNGLEEGVDCGGDCPYLCCEQSAECATKHCSDGKCLPMTRILIAAKGKSFANMDGLAKQDVFCNSKGQGAGGGKWVAFLGATGEPQRDLISLFEGENLTDVPVYTVSDNFLFSSWQEVFEDDGEFGPTMKDFDGNSVPAANGSDPDYAWTGVNSSGIAIEDKTCGDWTTKLNGTGLATRLSLEYLSKMSSRDCDELLWVLCVRVEEP